MKKSIISIISIVSVLISSFSVNAAEFNARTRIYQSVKPDFNPDVEYIKDSLARDIPSVDNSLFILAKN